MVGQQLSALDMAFLCLERATAPVHFGALLVFSAPPCADLCQLATLLGERAGRRRQLRQRVQPMWFPPGSAAWVEDPGFRIEDHLTVHHLGDPFDRDELVALVAELMAQPLQLNRPLWHMHLIGVLAGGGFAVLAKLHHAVCDGAGAVELGLGLFDGLAVSAQPPAGCEGGSRVSGLAAVRSARKVLAQLARCIGKTVALAGQGWESAAIVAAVVGAIRWPDPSRPLLGAYSPRRQVALRRLTLFRFQRVRARHGGTVNDVLLALVAGALRAWLMRRDGDFEGRAVRALVPVNRRRVSDPGFGRNRVSGYLCELPVGEPSPIRRLQKISAAMDRNKAVGARRGAGAFSLLADRVPGAVQRIAMPAVAGLAPLLYDLVISNVTLPAVHLALGGAGLHEVYPLVPFACGHALSVGACSYSDTICLGLYAQPHAMPDLADFADSLEPALDDLDDGPG